MPGNEHELESWLPLKAAADHLGVHPTTLRRWADKGDIPYLLTPGGHRRFAHSEIEAFAAARHGRHLLAPVEQVWAEKALTRIRRVLANPSSAAWLTGMDEVRRAKHRTLGRQLMGLTLQYISSEEDNSHVLEQARTVGLEYGHLSQEAGLPLSAALRVALYLRDELIEVAFQLTDSMRIRPEDNLQLLRRINRLLNVVHLAVVETYE